jgi:hypothetical protein
MTVRTFFTLQNASEKRLDEGVLTGELRAARVRTTLIVHGGVVPLSEDPVAYDAIHERRRIYPLPDELHCCTTYQRSTHPIPRYPGDNHQRQR